jgi:UDP-glucose 4-epimerase
LKAVGESVADPLKYYDVNVGGSVSLLMAMSKAECNNIVFLHLPLFTVIRNIYPMMMSTQLIQ